MRGSWPVLLLLGGVFLLGFFWLRSGSLVLRAEQGVDAALALARQNDVPPASVLALRAALWSRAGAPIEGQSQGDGGPDRGSNGGSDGASGGATDGAADAAAFARLVVRFAELQKELGEPLAAQAVLANEAGARAALAAGGGDPEAAWRRFRSESAALPALAFVQYRDRFLQRASGRVR